MSKEYCIARHNDKVCFLPSCRYHNILMGNSKELLQKLDAFCFNYQHVDCVYTLFKYRFSAKIVVKCGLLFDKMQRGSSFQPAKQENGQNAQHREKENLEGKVQKLLFSSIQKTKSTQTSGSVFADRIEQGKKTKLQLKLLEIVDCFLDGHGNYTCNLVPSKTKSL